MTKETKAFDEGNATIDLANQLKEYAECKAILNGGDAASALFGAAMKMIKDELGDEHVVPVAKMWLSTIIAADGAPTAYN